MRTLILTSLTFILLASAASATAEVPGLYLNLELSTSLSGTTTSGFDFADIPKAEVYGFLGAGFLVIAVLRRRKHIYRVQK